MFSSSGALAWARLRGGCGLVLENWSHRGVAGDTFFEVGVTPPPRWTTVVFSFCLNKQSSATRFGPISLIRLVAAGRSEICARSPKGGVAEIWPESERGFRRISLQLGLKTGALLKPIRVSKLFWFRSF